MKSRPLNDKEIKQAIEKIRKLYDDYIVTYSKPFRLKKEFDDRYYDALKSRIDLTGFVMSELEVVQQLQKTEEERQAKPQPKPLEKKVEPRRPASLADRVLDQHRHQIEHYPDAKLDPRAAFEIKKIFGALDTFEKEYWPPFESLLRRLYPSYYSNPRVDLEPRIYALCPGAGTTPPIASRYEALLLRAPQNLNDVEWEEKRLVLEAAYLLHQIAAIIDEIPLENCSESEKGTVEKTKGYVHTLITDFRMKDLKPGKLGGK